MKPDLDEAMKERIVGLKGAQYSSMNIPMIYRRTFNWDEDVVRFVPINKRSFVVFRTDLDKEVLATDDFLVRELDIANLPWYSLGRVSCEDVSSGHLEELREYLLSMSLSDRYVHIDVLRPKDHDIDKCLRADLELLANELGYQYSSTDRAYRCTFLFPVHSNRELLIGSSKLLGDSVDQLKDFLQKNRLWESHTVTEDLRQLDYSVRLSEVIMDRSFSEAINVIWDMPQVEPSGFFLITQACERAHDELEYIVCKSLALAEHLESQENDVRNTLWDMFQELWSSSITSSLDNLENALDGLKDVNRESVTDELKIIRNHRVRQMERTTPQAIYFSNLTTRIESLLAKDSGGGYLSILTKRSWIEAIAQLIAINQSSTRLNGESYKIASRILYLKNSDIRGCDREL